MYIKLDVTYFILILNIYKDLSIGQAANIVHEK